VLYWSGYLISDGIQEVDSGVPFDVTLTAIDGLQFLDNTPLMWNNYPSGRININGELNAQRAPINAFRVALYEPSNLGLPLPIRWNSSLKNDSRPTSDMIAGLTVINPTGQLSQTGKTNFWWLENLCKSAQSWLYQRNGRWYINRYFDTYGYEITTNTTSEQTPASILVNDITALQASDTINESWYWFGKKPLSHVEVTYDNTTFEDDNNFIPDGNFNTTILGGFLYWRMKSSGALLSQAGTLTGRPDSFSAEVNNISSEGNYLTTGEIPIDTELLYNTCQIGLKWMPVSGYALTSEGNIDFSQFPIHISVKLTIGANEHYLNEFGYWSDKNAEPNQAASITWNAAMGSLFVSFINGVSFFPGDQVNIRFQRGGATERYHIVFTETMDTQSGVDYIVSHIPNSSRVSA